MVLLEGPFESDYSLAIVNRQLAYGLIDMGMGENVQLHQRDNTTCYRPTEEFLRAHPRLAPLFVETVADTGARVHSRYIYPPFTDMMTGGVNAVHCFGWEESAFPRKYVEWFNKDVDVITVMSEYVRQVLKRNGVTVPIVVTGLGADHITDVASEPVDLDDGYFTFLHVSSCFPRKGADVLVEAFSQEFRREEKVQLILKTFPNPHNNIEEIVSQTGVAHRNRASIAVWQHPMSPGQMRYLYEHAGCVVAPSRGEGFGLPVAEAMLLGCPVVATAHSGHADLCIPGSFWPIEYRLQRATTHLSEDASLWAEPSVNSLRDQMRAVYQSGASERRARTEFAKAHIAENYTWRKVAAKHLDACDRGLLRKRKISPAPSNRLAFVTTWNTRCGIAEYTRALATNLDPESRFCVFADYTDNTVRPDTPNVIRSWRQPADASSVAQLVRELKRSDLDCVSIQFNFAFFGASALAALINELKASGISVIVSMHSVDHPMLQTFVPALEKADVCIVHRDADMYRLAEFGVSNTVVHRLGIVVPPTTHQVRIKSAFEPFVIAAFGFCLPPKGLHDLLRALALAVRVDDRLRLRCMNALHPFKESRKYAEACILLIGDLGLNGRVELWTKFLPEEKVLEELSTADLIVMPYTHSTESASAAVRQPLATLTPVLCSDLPVFEELTGLVHKYQAGDVFQLANTLLRLAGDPAELNKYERPQREYVDNLSWPKAAARFMDIVKAYTVAIQAEQAVRKHEHPSDADGMALVSTEN